MNEKTPKCGFDVSLRCLQHPLALSCIAVLLLNDHLLKVISPSWLTGKLSDFAGLFFFPFILSAALSLLLDRLRCPARWTGRVAFGLTGVWFALIKTTPWATTLTARIAFGLFRVSPQIILDFTDLLALVSLWPAWWLWCRCEKARPTRVAWVALIIGAFASLATSPAPPIPHIQRLAYQEDVLYAAASDGHFRARSGDGGRNWRQIPSDVEQSEDIFQEVILPLEVCSSSVPQQCYRITGEEQIEVSNDGGVSWEIAWIIPPGRRDFMQRFADWDWGSMKQEIDLGPYDMIIFQRDGSTYLLVAMGNEGVMRRQIPDGEWERFRVWSAHPSPYSEQDMVNALLIMKREISIWIGITLLTLLVSCNVGYRALLKQTEVEGQRHSTWQSLWPIFIAVSLSILGVMASVIVGETIAIDCLRGPFLLGLVLVPIVGFALAWRRVARVVPKPKVVQATAGSCLLAAVSVLLVGELPWFLWAHGILAHYAAAAVLAWLLTLVVLAGGLYLTHRVGKRSHAGAG